METEPTESTAVVTSTPAKVAAPIGSSEPIGTTAVTDDDALTTLDRPISEGVRRVFAEKMKERRATEAKLAKQSTSIHPDDPPTAAADATPVIPAVSPTSSPAAAAVVPAAVAAATPAASVADIVAQRNAAALELREQALVKREADLDARHAALATRENVRAQYASKPADVIRAYVKELTGADGDDLRAELGDLVTELTASDLGVPVPDAHKSRLESRRALREVKAWKAEAAETEAKAKASREVADKQALEQRQQADQQAREQHAVRVLDGYLAGAKDKYPHLAAEPNAAGVIFDVLKAQHADNPNAVPDWEGAAKLANDHFKTRNDQWLAARRDLLVTPTKPATASATAAVQPGERQGSRSSTLTNEDAATTTSPIAPRAPVQEDDGPYDREADTKALFARWREKAKAARQ